MAIFDDFREKFTQAGHSTVSKVRDLSEIARLNGEVADLENRISDLYSKIGFEIYKAYRDDPMPEIREMVLQLNSLHQTIKNNKATIQAINSANTCPQCGIKVKPGMAFCSGCGYKLAQEAISNKAAFCSNCGAPVANGTAFCTSCGTKIENT